MKTNIVLFDNLILFQFGTKFYKIYKKEESSAKKTLCSELQHIYYVIF